MRFARRPFFVDAIQVTEENIEEVAEWCNGDVRFADKSKNGKTKYVKVRVLRPLNERQSMAFVGDFILYAGTGYKVYTNKAFNESFEPVEEPFRVCGDDRLPDGSILTEKI